MSSEQSELEQVFARRRCSWASEVIAPGLIYLGSGLHASSLTQLQAHRISHVLNVADDVPCYHIAESSLTYLQLNVSDFGSDLGISRVFGAAFEFLAGCEAARQPTLVHCAAGMNRSATLVVAYIMHSRKMPLKEAFDFVRRCRSICPQKDMRRELLEFERRLFGASSFASDDDFFILR